MGAVTDLATKAARIAALGKLIETFDTPVQRLNLIKHLVDSGSITEFAGDILAEEYVREAL